MARKIIVLVVVLAVLPAATPLFSQQIDGLKTFESVFEDFTEEFAKSLPMNSMIGLNWSDAYIGQLLPVPSFGVGITSGFTTIPLSVFDSLVDDLVDDAGDALDVLPSMGVPFPGYAFDARVGGVFLPFDVGLKFGTIPDIEIGDVTVGYTNVGGDIRYAVLKGGVVMPKLSVGVGYNHLAGNVAFPLGTGDITLANVEDRDGNEYTLTLEEPNLEFDWTANVLDFKVQVSKQFFVVEPHLGLGASYGWAQTTAGLDTDVDVSPGLPDGVTLGDLVKAAGVDVDLEDTGLSISADENPFAIRGFGGVALTLPFFRLDLGGMYNFNSGAFGGTLGARFQM